jgi:hypothetical protein
MNDFIFTGVDPKLATPPPVQVGGPKRITYGKGPPELADIDDLCPATPVCPECPAVDPKKANKCQDGGLSLFDLIGRMEIRPFGNETYPGLPIRTQGISIHFFSLSFLSISQENK